MAERRLVPRKRDPDQVREVRKASDRDAALPKAAVQGGGPVGGGEHEVRLRREGLRPRPHAAPKLSRSRSSAHRGHVRRGDPVAQRQRLLRQPDGGARKRKGRPAVAEVRDRRGRAQHGTHAKPRETPRLGQRPYDEDVFPLQQFPRRVAVGELDVGEIRRAARRSPAGRRRWPGSARRGPPFPWGCAARSRRPAPSVPRSGRGSAREERGRRARVSDRTRPPASAAKAGIISNVGATVIISRPPASHRRHTRSIPSSAPAVTRTRSAARSQASPRASSRPPASGYRVRALAGTLREETDEFRRREQALVVIEPKPFARWRGHCQPAHATICPGVVTTRSVPPRAFTRGIRPGRASRSTATRMA